MACTGLDSLNPLCQLKQTVDSVASGVFDQIARDFARVAAHAVNWLWGQIAGATAIDLSGSGLKPDLMAAGAIAVVLTSILFLVQVVWSALRHQPGGLLRAVRGLGVAFIGSALAVACTQIVLTLVDELSAGVVQYAMGTTIEGLGGKLIAADAITTLSPAAELLLALVIIAAVVMVWLALMVRKLLIIVSAVFAPVAFSGATADISRGWVRKWIEMVAALASAKLILVIVLLVGVSVLGGAGTTTQGGGQAVTQTIVGALILLLGGLTPWLAVKMVHFAGDSVQVMHAHAGAATAAAATVAAAPQKMSTMVARGQQMASQASRLTAGQHNGDDKGSWSSTLGVPVGSALLATPERTGPSSAPRLTADGGSAAAKDAAPPTRMGSDGRQGAGSPTPPTQPPSTLDGGSPGTADLGREDRRGE